MKLNLCNKDLIKSFKTALPIVIGYVPLGLASGILSQKAGLSAIEIALLSIASYSGSGQFITASLLLSSASFLSIIITNFIVNCRYILMSSALSPYLKKVKKALLFIFSHGITDETFAVNLVNFKESKDWSTKNAILVNNIALLSWVLSNFIGALTGATINIDTLIINFILTSMFICLLVTQLKDNLCILAAAISGIVALIISQFTKNNLYVIFATFISATICTIIEIKKNKINFEEEVKENVT